MAPLITMAPPSSNPDSDTAAAVSSSSIQTEQSQATAAGSPTERRQKKELGMAAQKEIWNLEQEVIAALVHVEPDPPVDTLVIRDNPLFHLVRDDHKDVFSFSTAPELYGGVDVSFPIAPGDDGNHEIRSQTRSRQEEQAVAVYVVMDRRTMQAVYHDHIFFDLDIPYIPSYLAFREIAPLELLVQRQIQNKPEITPQAILVDGNGILHPRHAGIACFLGTRTDIPTIGVGKNLYYEGGWTRELVDEGLDNLIRRIHESVGTDAQLATELSRYRGLIVKKSRTTSKRDPTADHSQDVEMTSANYAAKSINRKQALQDLAPYCNGLAMPLVAHAQEESNPHAKSNKANDIDDRFPVLGCALVGHGGQIAATSRSQPHGGSSKPIFVSVGHKMSLQAAVQVAASLSVSRIPEPIRQADLYGREIMRRRAAKATTKLPNATSSS